MKYISTLNKIVNKVTKALTHAKFYFFVKQFDMIWEQQKNTESWVKDANWLIKVKKIAKKLSA